MAGQTDAVYPFILSQIFSSSPLKQHQLLEAFGSPQALFAADAATLKQAGLTDKQIQILTERKDFSFYQKQMADICAQGTCVLSSHVATYPERLRETADHPLILYARGDTSLLKERAILAVVGAREMTEYGERVLKDLIAELVQAGVVIVSGMAFGVDALAHRLCLGAGGKTIAVQAQGVDRGYPRSHQKIYDDIVQSGLVLSEFSASPKYMGPELFPRRNRLISGISDGVLVIEAKEKSGSLITAYFALEQNRNVYAIPGSLYQPMSQGCLELIKRGAKPVTRAQDILEDFHLQANVSRRRVDAIASARTALHFESPLHETIYTLCAKRAMSIDELVEETGEALPQITATLIKMQLMDHVEEISGRKFQKKYDLISQKIVTRFLV